MGLMHKPNLYTDPATVWLMGQSKAALADMLTEVLRCEQESADEPASAEAAEKKFAGVLESRKALKGLAKKFANRKDGE